MIVAMALLPVWIWGQRIQPGDLQYVGAFRLPDGPDEIAWMYSGQALAYYPEGDPQGPDDGFPGSLFGAGHDWNTFVSEISIPVPVISNSKNPADLNTAVTLQPFANIRPSFYNDVYLEQTRAGLAYLPAQGSQLSGKLYYCFAAHMGEGETGPAHGWCELDLSDPQPAGPWRLNSYWNYVTTDYIFDIPEAWAAEHTPGLRLATGRFRDGGQGSQGPTIFAYGPWNEGNPPAQGQSIDCMPLLQYGDVYTENSPTVQHYHHSDEWGGGAWLTAGDKSAVVFTGTKGRGNCWYGLIDGTVWEEPYPNDLPYELLETRGWWSESFAGQMLFYDTDQLAAVSRGEMEPWEPQPYDSLDMDATLYHIDSSRQKSHVMSCAFDRDHGFLYVMEPLADEDKSIIHVWRIQNSGTAVQQESMPGHWNLLGNFPNPFNPSTRIEYLIENTGFVALSVFDIRGRLIKSLAYGIAHPGRHMVDWDGCDASGNQAATGLYVVRLQCGRETQSRKMILIQ